MDKVSVIVPIFNAEKTLERCIKSILSQTYKNLEIILINDGSTDGSLDICEKFNERDNRIIIISQKNSGVSIARNNGLRKVSGKYIIFVDSDDYLDDKMIEILHSSIIKNKSDISICNKVFLINQIITKNTLYKCDEISRKNEEKDLFILYLFSSYFDPKMNNVKYLSCGVTAKMFKSSLILDNKIVFLENCHYVEDLLFNIHSFEEANKISYINYDGYIFNINDESSTHKFKEHWLSSYNAFIDNIEKYIVDKKKNTDVRFESSTIMMRYTRITGLLISYFFHKDNPKSCGEKIRDLKDFLKNEKYKNSIKNVNPKLLTKNQRILLYLLKFKMYYVIYLICKFRQR